MQALSGCVLQLLVPVASLWILISRLALLGLLLATLAFC